MAMSKKTASFDLRRIRLSDKIVPEVVHGGFLEYLSTFDVVSITLSNGANVMFVRSE